MKRRAIFLVSLASAGAITMAACSGDDNNTEDGGKDSSTVDATQDVGKTDTSTNDAANDVVTVDASDAGDGGCLASWLEVPDAGTSLVPDGGLPTLILHAAATGTQDYTCTNTTTDAGPTYAWVFVGPEANLDDCHNVLMGHHFASEAGATAPEWQTLDTSFVIGKKLVAYDAGSAAIPWLLLQETSNGGSGEIAKTLYVQRLFTTGGTAPTATCDSGSSLGTTQKVNYTADYYFYGN